MFWFWCLYHVLQYGGVGVDRLIPARSAQVEGVIHVGVGGGKPPGLQPAGEGRTHTITPEEGGGGGKGGGRRGGGGRGRGDGGMRSRENRK